MVQHAAPRMSQGSITFTSGSLSSRPRPGTAMLAAILAAVEALTPALALELAPVRVNAVTSAPPGRFLRLRPRDRRPPTPPQRAKPCDPQAWRAIFNPVR